MRIVDLSITDGAGRTRTPYRPGAAVGIPMTEFVPRTGFWNFAFLFTELNPKRDRLIPVYTTAVAGEARNQIIKDFLKEPGQEFLILIDSDMKPYANTVDMLVSRNLPFVSGYCTRKTYPYLPIPSMLAGTRVENGETIYDYAPISNWEPDSGVRTCDGVGAALLCLRRDLLERMEPPYFKYEGGGEDLYFCRKVQALGEKIHVDTACMAGHIGEYVADPHDFWKHKDEYLASIGEREVTLQPNELGHWRPVEIQEAS